MEEEQEPPTKRLKLTLEPVPEKRVTTFFEDGTELEEDDKTPAEKFVEHLRQLDWRKDNEGEEKEEEKPKTFEDYKWHQVRSKVEQNLGRSLWQVARMVDIIEMAKAGVHCTVEKGTKPPITEREEQNQVLFQVGSKRKQLEKAREKISLAAASLRQNLEVNNRYFQEVFELRNGWKVGSPASDLPIYTVDYSLKNDGSRNLARELPITKNHFGNIELTVNNAMLYKTLQIGTDDCNILVPSYSFQTSIISEVANEPSSSVRVDGVKNCHTLLSSLQESLFSSEIFDTLAKAAVQKSSLLQLLENVIKFETTDEKNFSISLVSPQSPPGSLALDKGDMSSQTREIRENIFKILGVYLHQLVRARHIDQREEDHRFKLSRDFLRPKDPKDSAEVKILEKMLTLYRHLRLCDELVTGLHKLSCTMPFITYSTVNSPSPVVSIYEVVYDKSLIITATVLEDKISLPSIDNLESFQEFVKHVTHRLILYTLDVICGNFSLFVSATNVLKKGTKVIVTVSPNIRLMIKAEVPADPTQMLFPVTVSIFRTKMHEEVEETKLDWWKLKGGSNQEKAVGLILSLLRETN
eukprot:TRINITY_DN6908_c0_g1_i2.p1 TRINITY_DN6908_c0_g1~~TRINITY_DN6908_c0_g1_i2.p1  ORF type:complete len:581 (-),score=117.36 TRINITY_DN6908_c0_g1_i2:19-1761(-)